MSRCIFSFVMRGSGVRIPLAAPLNSLTSKVKCRAGDFRPIAARTLRTPSGPARAMIALYPRARVGNSNNSIHPRPSEVCATVARWSESKRPPRAHARTAHRRRVARRICACVFGYCYSLAHAGEGFASFGKSADPGVTPLARESPPFPYGAKGYQPDRDGLLRQTRGERSMT